MTRMEFDAVLRKRLSGLSAEELERSLEYYDEMIAEEMELGLSEEAAVAAMGDPDEIVAEILADVPLPHLIKKRVSPLPTWGIILLVIGAPLWLPLLLAVVATAVAIFIALWSVIVSLYAAVLALAVAGIAGVIYTAHLFFTLNMTAGFFLLGAGLASAGLAILLFLGTVWLTKLLLKLGKAVILWVKRLLLRKEREE